MNRRLEFAQIIDTVNSLADAEKRCNARKRRLQKKAYAWLHDVDFAFRVDETAGNFSRVSSLLRNFCGRGVCQRSEQAARACGSFLLRRALESENLAVPFKKGLFESVLMMISCAQAAFCGRAAQGALLSAWEQRLLHLPGRDHD